MRTSSGWTAAAVPTVIAAAPQMQTIVSSAQRIAGSGIKVLITGESGVGKDVLARYIHAHSTRADGPFVALNCAGLSETLLESELFGHVKGSFTGAHRDKVGKLQLANRGTVFLDEVGEMSPRMQALLLRFLESGEVHQVGADSVATSSDVRVVSATNRDLVHMVSGGLFREDLLYRIKVAHLHVPPLRERREDIPAFVEYALRRSGAPCTLTPEAMDVLSRYSWPGNVRELQNVIEQVISLASGAMVKIDDLPRSVVTEVLGNVALSHERRRQLADEIYEALVSGEYGFWKDLQTLFLNRDITRRDLRDVVRRGLRATHGSYRALLHLFRIDSADYKRFLNFLAAHDCRVDFREFRSGAPPLPMTRGSAHATQPSGASLPR
jgi:transcriptional regulator with PAS, ATPase and Fis domain